MIGLDKIIMLLSLVVFRIGWWGTIFCQQILLGMLTIFGPLQWAFSLLPKWEGAWAKWITRYLTVHFYGAMLYFVGFSAGDTRRRILRVFAELFHDGGLSVGSFVGGLEVPEPRAGLGSVDDTRGRHGFLDKKLRRGRGQSSKDKCNVSNAIKVS